MTKRFKMRFPSADAMYASQALETPNTAVVLQNAKRAYIAVEVPDVPDLAFGPDASSFALQSAPELRAMAETYGAEIVEDYQYEPDVRGLSFEGVDVAAAASLSDVTNLINADAAWAHSTGKNVTIAIVDTGIDGSYPEFPMSKRAGHWEAPGDAAWTDWEGHGTMCATISAANKAGAGSRYRGVAPDANLVACKTHFYDSELGAVYDYLVTLIPTLPGRLIASNSFGQKTGTPPPVPAQSDFLDAVNDAITAGILVFFSAGNNHQAAGGLPADCHPNSIWLHKSRADVFPVATCDLQRAMWYYSSRGPGQHHGDPGTSRKPDATAPTPANGKILYGAGERVLPNGWGTSGACPQAAGLAALMLSVNSSLDRQAVFDIIRHNAVDLGYSHECQGHGMINCAAAVNHVRSQLTS